MRHLLILRHAHSEPAGPRGDRGRALSARGHAQCCEVLKRMGSQGWIPDMVLCSPASRTRETWERIAEIAPRARVETPEDLYLGGVEAYEKVLAGAEGETVLLVGHNPTCAALAMDLHGAPDLHPMLAQGRYPTASLILADLEDAQRVARSFFTPDDVGPGRSGD